MSIQKDVEKLYMGDIEKQKKNQKKKKRKKITALVILIIFIIGIILLMNYLGLGFGGKKGNDSQNAADSTNANSETTVTTTEPPVPIDFKVSGSTYIYDGQEITLDKFCENIKLMSSNVVVNIIDDNATKNAMDDLKKALDEIGRQYTQKKQVSSSVAENSSENSSSKI